MIIMFTFVHKAMQMSSKDIQVPETSRETSVIIPLLITVLFQIRTLVSNVE